MDKLFDFLLKNPILLFVIGAWVVGMLSNAAKAKKRADERRSAKRQAESQPVPVEPPNTSGERPALPVEPRGAKGTGERPPLAARRAAPAPQSAPSRPQQPAAQPAGQNADEVAREMRRILGLDPEPAAPAPASRAPTPPPVPKPAPRPVNRPSPPAIEVRMPSQRSPAPKDRSLEVHVDPHVGEGIRDRHMAASKVGQPRGGRAAIGSLGGRVQVRKTRASSVGSRYSIEDLKRAFVLSEILSPPLALRSFDERRPSE